MSFAKEHIELFVTTSLQSLFPAGMFDAEESAGSGNAWRAISIIESLIKGSTAQNALFSNYSLLQSFPRISSDSDLSTEQFHSFEDVPVDFVRQYAIALTPEYHHEFLGSLDDQEAEIFLKNYVLAHELWGHPEGVALLVRTMMEYCTQIRIPVRVEELQGETRSIPESLRSRLGANDEYSKLGNDFVLGARFTSRPRQYQITIGPISIRSLEKIREKGWAEELRPSRKLVQLAECATPFYFHPTIRILVEMTGYVLGRVALGRDRLGTVVSEKDDGIDVLTGVDATAQDG